MKSKKNAEGITTKEAREFLQYFFTREEKEDMSQLLARRISELSLSESRKKEVVKALDADISKFENEIKDLANKVKDGYTYKNIDCDVIMDYNHKSYTIIRRDTGAVVTERAMTADELQTEMEMRPL